MINQRLKVIYILVSLFFTNHGFSQENPAGNKSRIQLSIEGMIGASFGKNFYTINIGGPSLLLNVNKEIKVGFVMLPSIYAENGKFGTRLGMSPRVDYKSFVFMLPLFPSQSFGKWVGSVGIGYKFQKRSK